MTLVDGGLDPDGNPASAYNYSAVLPWRPSGEHHTTEAAEHALVLGTASSASASGGRKTRAVVVDLYTGDAVSDVVLPFAAAHMLPLPSAAEADDHHEPSAMLLVDEAGGKAHVFPDTEDARAAAYVDRPRMTYFTVDQEKSEIRGYALLPAPDKRFGAASYSTAQTWTSRFPAEIGDIVGFASKPSNEVVNSWVRVLGDRSTLFKYLSPNVIFVATAPRGKGSSLSPRPTSTHSRVSLYPLDFICPFNSGGNTRE